MYSFILFYFAILIGLVLLILKFQKLCWLLEITKK